MPPISTQPATAKGPLVLDDSLEANALNMPAHALHWLPLLGVYRVECPESDSDQVGGLGQALGGEAHGQDAHGFGGQQSCCQDGLDVQHHHTAQDELGLLQDIYDSDQGMYPAPHLSFDRLVSWVVACPELSVRYGSSSIRDVHGLIIVLPLVSQYWQELVDGSLEEHDVDPNKMFPSLLPAPGVDSDPQRLVRVGLHIFHIERRAERSGWQLAGLRFTEFALEEIRRRVQLSFKHWHILGWSALTVTRRGRASFKRAGFNTEYVKTGDYGDDGAPEMMKRTSNDRFC